MGTILDQGSDLATILSFLLQIILLAVAGIAGGTIGYNRAKKQFQNKKEKRLFENIQRPVAILPSIADKMELESRLLKAIDFFTVDLLPNDARSLNEITAKYRLAVVRYEDTPTFWRVFHALADKQIPLIIYSKPAEIPVPKLQEIQEYYTRYTLCNTPVRLVSDVFAIMSVYPEDK